MVILQKPSLFEGTLLSNITPNRISLTQVRDIRTDLVDLEFDRKKLAEESLGFRVEPEGKNLSQSEKQTIGMMQSLQKKSKIVILDEATAYVDVKIQGKINNKLYESFKDSTMFVIAHRLENVINLDRILVFDQGRVVEDGSPSELLSISNGVFREIWLKEQ